MFAPLKHLFHELIRDGRLVVRDPQGQEHEFGNGEGEPVAIRLTNRRIEWELTRDPELAVGEGYMQGSLIAESGSIYDFIDLAMRNAAAYPLPPWTQAFAKLRRLKRLSTRNPVAASAHNVHFHYDLDPRIYDLFLDTNRQYSCAYFAPGITRLEEAQLAKMRHIAAKLRLQPAHRVLDIGCGWGGLARYLAEASQADVRGITLSGAQLKSAIDHAPPTQGSCTFAFEDYRTVKGTFDRIVSVGMFEHVGPAHYDDFFRCVRERLSDDGVALIHAIGRLDGPAPTNPFVARYIFPGGALPALSEVTATIEKSGLIMTDIEILRLHYAETLRQWRQRFLARADRAAQIAGPAFVRMWEFYLAGCEAAFRHQNLIVFQVQLAKKIGAVPLTRDYMLDAERRMPLRPARKIRPLGAMPLVRREKG